MTKGLDMSTCLLLPSYVSIAARKRARLTKVAGECHLESLRIRGVSIRTRYPPLVVHLDPSMCGAPGGAHPNILSVNKQFSKDCGVKLNLSLFPQNYFVF